MTPDKNFRLSKTAKATMALTKGSPEARSQYKRMMIDAQLTEEHARRLALKSSSGDRGDKPTTGGPRNTTAISSTDAE